MKELKKKITAATSQKEQLEKKKKKMSNRMTVMPKQEEIRVVVDGIRVVQGEIETLKREVAVKQQAIKYIKKG